MGLYRIQSRGSLRTHLAGQKRVTNKASLKTPQFPREYLKKPTPNPHTEGVLWSFSWEFRSSTGEGLGETGGNGRRVEKAGGTGRVGGRFPGRRPGEGLGGTGEWAGEVST